MNWYNKSNLLSLNDIRNPKENIQEVIDANFTHGIIVGKQVENIDKLTGGVRLEDPQENMRVKNLARQISSPNGYFERLIVDDQGNVLEGQHRFEAAKLLGVTRVPIIRVADFSNIYDINSIKTAIESSIRIHPDQVKYLIDTIIENIQDAGSPEEVLNYYMPAPWDKPYLAGIQSIINNKIN